MDSRTAWAVRPNPCHVNRMREFLEQGMVAVGWPRIGDLTGASRDELKRRLLPLPYVQHDARAAARQAGELDRFVNAMQVGDLVVVPNRDEIYVAEVASDYVYRPDQERPDDGYSHWRLVEYLNDRKAYARVDLPADLARALRTQITVFSVPVDGVRELIHKTPPPSPEHVRPPIYGAEALIERIEAGRGLPERNMEAIVEDLLARLGHDRKRLVFQAGRIDVAVNDATGKPLYVFEVKRNLDNRSLRDQARRQGFDYAGQTGARFVVLTDGDVYEIYDREAGLDHDSMRLGAFRLTAFRREDLPLLDRLRPTGQTL